MSAETDQSYRKHPELTRYVSADRYDKPKEDFKKIEAKLDALLDKGRPYDVADVGCGNGELLYHLRRRHPHWRLYGFDHTPEFVETAKRFPGLAGVEFACRDLSEIDGVYDVVIATCFLSLFRDIEPPLAKLLDICREGGYVLATGLFNPFDIEVRVEFCDNTNAQTRGEWRTDFNRHSQASVRRMLAGRARSVAFEECEYDVHIAPDRERPMRVWTSKDQDGKTSLINGAWQFANQVLLIVHK